MNNWFGQRPSDAKLLIAKNEAGANVIWTFIQTVKLNQLKVCEYLDHLLPDFAWIEKPVWEVYLPWDPEIHRRK